MSAVASLRMGIRGMVLCLGLGIGCMLRGAVSSDQEKLAQANTDFAFKLLQELAREQPGKNIFISPYSVSTVLQMVGNGAGGQTRAELQQVRE